jgi:BirA family biotin operon repressor/biotin-[acetyl-CoA-carboxylase] ligase
MKELLAKGEWREGERFLYTAFQTAGRGQAGNGWESEEGKNLLCSILLPPRKELFDLNVLTAVAVQRLLGEGFTIKWPNDIYLQDKKVAGLLIENAIIGNEVKYSIAGIGLNVNQTIFLSSAPNPVSLKQISGKETDIDALMQALMTQLEALEAMDEAQVWAYYRDHLYRREGFWPFVEREVSTAPTMNAEKGAEGIFLAKIENVRTNGEIELRDQAGNLRTYHFKQVRYVL